MTKRRRKVTPSTRRNRKDNLFRATTYFTNVHRQSPQVQPLALTVEAPPVDNGVSTLALTETVEAPLPDLIHEDEKEGKRDWLTQHVNRLLISRYYSDALSSPPPCEWTGYGGTFGIINTVYPSLSLNLIKSIVKDTYACESEGMKYIGVRKDK